MLFALEPGPKPLRAERKFEGGGNKNPPSLVLPLDDDAHAHADDNSAKGKCLRKMMVWDR